jgi:hypothetical protein
MHHLDMLIGVELRPVWQCAAGNVPAWSAFPHAIGAGASSFAEVANAEAIVHDAVAVVVEAVANLWARLTRCGITANASVTVAFPFANLDAHALTKCAGLADRTNRTLKRHVVHDSIAVVIEAVARLSDWGPCVNIAQQFLSAANLEAVSGTFTNSHSAVPAGWRLIRLAIAVVVDSVADLRLRHRRLRSAICCPIDRTGEDTLVSARATAEEAGSAKLDNLVAKQRFLIDLAIAILVYRNSAT